MGRKYGDFFNHNLNAVICTPNITGYELGVFVSYIE